MKNYEMVLEIKNAVRESSKIGEERGKTGIFEGLVTYSNTIGRRDMFDQTGIFSKI